MENVVVISIIDVCKLFSYAVPCGLFIGAIALLIGLAFQGIVYIFKKII